MNITEIPLARAITATSVALVLACSVRANSGQTSHPATSKGAADVSRIAPPADMDRIGIKNGAWVIPDDVDLAQSSWRRAMDEHRARQRAKFGPVNRPDQLKKAFVETVVFLYDRSCMTQRPGAGASTNSSTEVKSSSAATTRPSCGRATLASESTTGTSLTTTAICRVGSALCASGSRPATDVGPAF